MARIVTEQIKREKALRVAVSRAKEDSGIRCDLELASAIGIDPSTYSRHKKNSYQSMSFSQFAKLARVLNFTPKEVCESIGVPYKEVIT